MKLVFQLLMTFQFSYASSPYSLSPNINSEKDFNRTAQMITQEFTKDFARIGKELRVVPEWYNPQQNSSTEVLAHVAVIHLLGGYAQVMSEDAFLLVACHETGHHLGGPPFYFGTKISVEGQADYFATSKCMRRLLKDQDNEAFIKRYGAQYSVRIDCNRVWGADTKDSYLCMRSIMAAMNLRFRMDTNRRDHLNQKDHTHVDSTNAQHPSAQYRFDTHRAGALCPLSQDELYNGRNTPTCEATRAGEQSAARPNCWYDEPTDFN